MVRDLRRLADTRFDLLIVGAGFYGAIAAWDATLRGLSVAIIDRGDFGGGTSFNNLKTLHGGLRSLQALNLAQMRLFIRERRALARVAPHLVTPLPFVIPTYRHPLRSAPALRTALLINDLVSRDRNQGVRDPRLQLPRGRILSRDETLQRNPAIDPAGVTGGAMWHDYQMHNTDRMTLAFILSATSAGATAINYVRATGFIRDGARIAGVEAVDRFSGAALTITARTVLNAAGPWAPDLLQTLGGAFARPAWKLSRAMNVVLRGRRIDHACGGLARGRFLFLVPWRHVSMVGTSHDVHDASADALAVTPQDLDAFLADAREAFPRADLRAADVTLVHRGLLPMVRGDASGVTLLRESAVRDHRSEGAPGLISMFGVRYTTARATAARAIDAVFRDRGDGAGPPCRTADTPVLGGSMDSLEALQQTAAREQVAGLTPASMQRLVRTYGTAYDAVLRAIREHPALAGPLGHTCEVTAAEIVHAARAEGALTLVDALIRRTEAGSAGHPGADAVAYAADLLAAELNWTAQERQAQIESVDAFYRLAP